MSHTLTINFLCILFDLFWDNVQTISLELSREAVLALDLFYILLSCVLLLIINYNMYRHCHLTVCVVTIKLFWVNQSTFHQFPFYWNYYVLYSEKWIMITQERIRGRSVQPIELSEPKVRCVHCKNLPYKKGFCRPHKTAIVNDRLIQKLFDSNPANTLVLQPGSNCWSIGD